MCRSFFNKNIKQENNITVNYKILLLVVSIFLNNCAHEIDYHELTCNETCAQNNLVCDHNSQVRYPDYPIFAHCKKNKKKISLNRYKDSAYKKYKKNIKITKQNRDIRSKNKLISFGLFMIGVVIPYALLLDKLSPEP